MTDMPVKPEEEKKEPSTHSSAAPAKKGTSGLAVAGLVLGLIALLSCWIPLFNALTTPLAILGLIFAIIGIVATAPAKQKSGRGIAIAGCVLCAISIVVFFAMYGGAAASVSSDESQSSNTEITAPAEEEDKADDKDASTKDEAVDEEQASDSDTQGIVVKSCKAARDYAGDKTAVITIEWTNETGETNAFATTYSDTAYVDGEQVNRTSGSGEGWYNDLKKIKKGKTQTIKMMYEWDGKSDIEFEVSKLFFGSDPIISKTLKVK